MLWKNRVSVPLVKWLGEYASSLQPLDCKTVRIFAYSSKRQQSNKRSGTRLKTESETGERRYGRVRLARALRARKTRTPRFTDFFTDFEKKNRLFCSLCNPQQLTACFLHQNEENPNNQTNMKGRSIIIVAISN